MFRLTRSKKLVAIIAFSLALAGCVTTQDAQLSPAEQRLKQSASRFNETVATGAVAGAVLGAFLGALAAGPNNRQQGAMFGAAAGTAIGAGSGYYIATRNEQYASREQTMNARLTAAQREVDSFRDLAQSSRQVAEENTRKLSALGQRFDARQISADEYRRQAAASRQMSDLMTKTIAEGEKVSRQLDQDTSSASGADQRTLAEAKRQVDQQVQVIRESQVRLAQSLAALPG
jgi:uncharacterized protein YcfJ